MSDVKLCEVCGKNEVSCKCDICKVSLCDMCKEEVRLAAQTPGQAVKPGVTMSSLHKASWKKTLCPKCLEEEDVY
ncbi:MAG: hypothetical protein WC560_07800 [Syntrophales bacterium]